MRKFIFCAFATQRYYTSFCHPSKLSTIIILQLPEPNNLWVYVQKLQTEFHIRIASLLLLL